MSDEPSYILNVTGLAEDETAEIEGKIAESAGGRNWIGIHFECCGVYTRIYRNREHTAYVGNCPRCSRPVRVRIGPGGTDHRLFRAT